MALMMVVSFPTVSQAQEKGPLSTAQKLTAESYGEGVKEQYDVYRLSNQYHVNPEALTDAIIKGETSAKFSPFSELEVIGQKKRIEKPVSNAVNSEHTVENQDSTAYLAAGNPGASGAMPWVGSCAVHKVSGTSNTPLIPFGITVSYLNRTVNIGGNDNSAFVVNDTGDPEKVGSSYWTARYPLFQTVYLVL